MDIEEISVEIDKKTSLYVMISCQMTRTVGVSHPPAWATKRG